MLICSGVQLANPARQRVFANTADLPEDEAPHTPRGYEFRAACRPVQYTPRHGNAHARLGSYAIPNPDTPGGQLCVPASLCSLGSTYETQPPTATSDRICSRVTECVARHTFETHPASLTSDRVCAPISAECQAPQLERYPGGLYLQASFLRCAARTLPSVNERRELTPRVSR
eukprot:m.12661 g.12661  ORF g.12661 m.12661 type:complete len:173 (+) comp17610_c0_seq1:213-731(+)